MQRRRVIPYRRLHKVLYIGSEISLVEFTGVNQAPLETIHTMSTATIATRIIASLALNTVKVFTSTQSRFELNGQWVDCTHFSVQHNTGYEFGVEHYIEVDVCDTGIYLSASCSGRTPPRKLRSGFSYGKLADIIANRAGDQKWTARARFAA